MLIDSQDFKEALNRRAKKYSDEIKVHTEKGNSYMVNWLTGVEMSLIETILAIREAEEAALNRDPSKGIPSGY